jgi:hypothetical protein
MKSTGKYFVLFNKVTTPFAAVYSMAMMCAVSMLWWRTLTRRQYNKRRMFQVRHSPSVH